MHVYTARRALVAALNSHEIRHSATFNNVMAGRALPLHVRLDFLNVKMDGTDWCGTGILYAFLARCDMLGFIRVEALSYTAS